MNDESFDGPIRSAMADGLSLVGDDVGTPIIAVTGRNGRVGLFGPVITTMPSAAVVEHDVCSFGIFSILTMQTRQDPSIPRPG